MLSDLAFLKMFTTLGNITFTTLIHINKIQNHSSALPLSIIVNIIFELSPVQCETFESWLKIHDNFIYRNFVFYKGPLYAVQRSFILLNIHILN